MAKIRHIAIRAGRRTDRDVLPKRSACNWSTRASGPIDLTDGDVNITLLPLACRAASSRARRRTHRLHGRGRGRDPSV
jgi:hypothetical protein